MCTITWIIEKESYEIFFNRDELRSRSEAHGPELFEEGVVRVIHPIDPDGSGSWICTNDRGISAALLNFNIPLEDKSYSSRGSIITDICSQKTIEQMISRVNKLDLKSYRGFTLCLFEKKKNPLIFRWDGETMKDIEAIQPLTSSSVKLPEVKMNREFLYCKMIEEFGDNRETHLSYHKSHIPEKSYLSTCMHRKDAETVSFSHIKSGMKKIEFDYFGKSLCRESDMIRLSMNKIQGDK